MPILFRIVAALILLASPLAAQNDSSCETDKWYCVEALNTGLPPVPNRIDRETPRATMESLVNAARKGAWGDAAYLLDLSALPPEDQRAAGARLASQLETVISRKTVIDWGKLQDRPDGLDETAFADKAMAGVPRRSLLLWTLDLGAYPAAIRLNRVKPPNGDAVWVFSRQTVEDIPALYDLYGPGRLERMLPDVLKERSVFDLALWELIALPTLIALAVTAARLFWILANWSAGKVSSRLAKDVIRSMRGPASFGGATLFIMIVGANVFSFSAEIATILVPAAWLGLIGSGLWFVVNFAEVILDRLTQVENTDLTRKEEVEQRTTATRISAARRVFVVAVVLVGSGIFLAQTNVFQNLGLTLLGTAGALTLVLGFAARSILSNIMSSLQIALNGSAKIGDRIVFNDCLCHVERIHFTYVQLRDWDGTRFVVPVTEFVSTPFKNWTMQEPEMIRTITIKCAHSVNIDTLREAFDQVLDELDEDYLGDRESASVRVAGQDALGQDVWFLLPCADPNTSWVAACDAREKIIAALNEQSKEDGVDYFPTGGHAAID